MEANCVLYRANRLTPIALNLPCLSEALGNLLHAILWEYWTQYPNADANFLLEALRFCEFVATKIARGQISTREIKNVLEREMAQIVRRLNATSGER